MDYDLSSESTNCHPGTCSEYDRYIACVYWAIQTMTSVGYGDMTPSHTAGAPGHTREHTGAPTSASQAAGISPKAFPRMCSLH